MTSHVTAPYSAVQQGRIMYENNIAMLHNEAVGMLAGNNHESKESTAKVAKKRGIDAKHSPSSLQSTL